MRTVVAVLRGGPSGHAPVSLESGKAVLAALNAEQYHVRDVFISPSGYWHHSGVPVHPERALHGADVVINCLHGYYGEDGWMQQLLHKLGHSVVGSPPAGAALAFNREL